MGKIGGQSSLMEDIEREIEVMKLLAHENIVALQEVINDPADHYIYIIQEYCSGGEIQNEGEPLNEEKARKYFRSCLRAVEYMHSQHVIHRDIKPENILLDKNADANSYTAGTLTFSGYQFTPATDGGNDCFTPNLTDGSIFNDKSSVGSTFEADGATICTVVATGSNSVGANPSDFSWTYASSKGAF